MTVGSGTVERGSLTGRAAVLVVDDHPIIRRGLGLVLTDQSWVSRVYEASGTDEAVEQVTLHAVHVVVMDLRLGAESGVDATSRLLAVRSDLAVVVVTMVDAPNQVAAAISAGARGYVLKTSSPEEICAALELVWRGGVVLGSGLGPDTLSAGGKRPLPALELLTPAEGELAKHLATGASNAKLARELGVSEKTIRNRVSALLVKLEVPDRVAAVIAMRDAGVAHGREPRPGNVSTG